MPAFQYTALDEHGKRQGGTLEADSARQLRQQLRDQRWTVLSVEAVAESSNDKSFSWFQRRIRLSSTDLAALTRQLATLVQAAMPIEEALGAMAAQQEKQSHKNLLLTVRSRVLEGHSLATGLEAFPTIFSTMFCSTVAAGEMAGHLDRVLSSLADYTEERARASQKIQQALVYPILLILVCLGIVSFLLGFVVPDIVSVFVETNQSLPWITEMLMTLSDGFQRWWPLLLGVIVASAVAFRLALNRQAFRFKWHRLLLRLPLLGKFIRLGSTARFASTLSIMARSGVPLVDGLTICSRVIHNLPIQQAVIDATQKVREGVSLNRALTDAGYFPPLMLHMIASGEATGELDQMLDRVAQNQQLELEGKMTVLLSLFEPLMLVVMGGVVMTIVLAILLPILNMNQLL